MAEPQGTWPVAVLCEVLEVSRSGLDAYLPRQATPAVEAEAVPSEPESRRVPRTRATVLAVVAWPDHARLRGVPWAVPRRGG